MQSSRSIALLAVLATAALCAAPVRTAEPSVRLEHQGWWRDKGGIKINSFRLTLVNRHETPVWIVLPTFAHKSLPEKGVFRGYDDYDNPFGGDELVTRTGTAVEVCFRGRDGFHELSPPRRGLQVAHQRDQEHGQPEDHGQGVELHQPVLDRPEQLPQQPWREWSAQTFEVRAESPVSAGVDGEALKLEPPLLFRIRPRVLRVRVARQNPGASPSARLPEGLWEGVAELGRIAAGRTK